MQKTLIYVNNWKHVITVCEKGLLFEQEADNLFKQIEQCF